MEEKNQTDDKKALGYILIGILGGGVLAVIGIILLKFEIVAIGFLFFATFFTIGYIIGQKSKVKKFKICPYCAEKINLKL